MTTYVQVGIRVSLHNFLSPESADLAGVYCICSMPIHLSTFLVSDDKFAFTGHEHSLYIVQTS